MSLFGQPSSTSGTIGGTTGTNTGSGLFGSLNNNNTANSNPLNVLNKPSTSIPSFSLNQPAAQQPAPATQSTGLFGANNGAQQNTQNIQPQAPSVANTLTTNTTANTLSTSLNSNQIPTSTIASTTSSSSRLLKDLIESASNLPKLDNHDLGSIHLTLGELQRKSKEMIKQKENKTNFTKAHYLLASSGISAEEIENDLKSIDFSVEREAGPVAGTNNSTGAFQINKIVKPKHVGIDQFLNTKKEENILATIEHSLAAASKDFDDYISKTISIDWKVRRNELRKSIMNQSFKKSTAEKFPNSITWNKSVPGNYSILSPLNGASITANAKSSTRQYTRDKFEKYATIIYQLNESRLSTHYYPLLTNFEELNRSSNDLKSKQITDVLKILIELTDECNLKVSQEQKFFHKYQTNSVANQKEKVELNELIIKKSKKYLESQFLKYMEELYLKDNDKNDYLPVNNINKVKFFINKIIAKNNPQDFTNKTLKVNGTPIWALIYYLLRSGLYDEALQLVLSNKEVFEKFDKNFPLYLKKYFENDAFKLPSELNDRLVAEFNQQFSFISDDYKNLFDPYKYSVYKIIGKCDLSKKSLPSSINLSIEDWLWFHLSIINENNNASELIYENYTLENLQKQIIQFGARKLNTSSNNPMYLKCLIMCGLYELAIQYSHEFINEIDSVHLAIALNYYGLLKVSSNLSKDELIFLNPTLNEYEVNFLRLIGSFTRTFKISDPKVACQYLILISMSKGGDSKEEIDHCHEALRELILISREFNLLLGELDVKNGEKTSGLLEIQRSLIKLDDIQDFYSQIIESSAKKCEEEGRVVDALTLYQLCQDCDTVLDIINRILSELLSTTELNKSLIKSGNYENTEEGDKHVDTVENNIVLLSKHIIGTFNNNSTILTRLHKSKKNTSDILLSIVSIRESFLNKNFNQVLLDIENLNLIPINAKADLIQIRETASFVENSLDDSILKVIPSLLVIVMTSISQINYQILTKTFKSLVNENDEIARLKKMAKNTMIFAGIIQYNMPRETYSLLIQLESQL